VPHGLSDTPFHEARRAASADVLGPKAAAAFRFVEEDFRTRDGIHLTPEGQEAVARGLEKMLLDASDGVPSGQ
jgi:lysophospholipase L1-like esterase